MRTFAKSFLVVNLCLLALSGAMANDYKSLVSATLSQDRFTLVEGGKPVSIIVSSDEDPAILRAAGNLQEDFFRVTGSRPELGEDASSDRVIIIGSLGSPYVREIVAKGKMDEGALRGCHEKFLIQTVTEPVEGVSEALVISGSDRRGVYTASMRCPSRLECLLGMTGQMSRSPDMMTFLSAEEHILKANLP